MEFQFSNALPVLRRTPAVLRALLLDLPSPWIGATEGPGTSSPFDVVDRIEEGAAGLAAFAEGLSEAEWRIPVSGTDGRSVGRRVRC